MIYNNLTKKNEHFGYEMTINTGNHEEIKLMKKNIKWFIGENM